ncbi:MAG: T9SS type B sorting domain-containing protein, partial [Flavobacteriaceae bacterium]|nr:T9SS type B sorting domain-containing protein [Flavobacteriaceae bacterium]
PNAITPNGDGINDAWVLRNLREGTLVQVYDRYGKLLFEKRATSASENIQWDGKYLGRNVPTTSYWYVITTPEGKKLTGWVVVRNYNSLEL